MEIKSNESILSVSFKKFLEHLPDRNYKQFRLLFCNNQIDTSQLTTLLFPVFVVMIVMQGDLCGSIKNYVMIINPLVPDVY